MEIFWNDESGYAQWRDSHPNGYVLNLPRNLTPSTYIMLHQATCGHIADPGPTAAPLNYTTNDYYKVCGMEREKIVAWVSTQRGTFKHCAHCKP